MSNTVIAIISDAELDAVSAGFTATDDLWVKGKNSSGFVAWEDVWPGVKAK